MHEAAAPAPQDEGKTKAPAGAFFYAPRKPDFDPAQIHLPFRMQPGLRRMGAQEVHFTPLQPGSALQREKAAVLAEGAALLQLPGFDAQPALQAIAAALQAQGLGRLPADALSLAQAIEEDFAVLDGADGRLALLCVCLPSRWVPQDKLGLGFAAVHAPVADNQALLAAGRALMHAVTQGAAWAREVWSLSPSPRHDQHPQRMPEPCWDAGADAQALAAQCWLRSEQQTFLPVPQAAHQAVFTIRVQMQPLRQAVRTPLQAQRLHDALASMSEAVLRYKNLQPARERLLHWLAQRAAAATATATDSGTQ